MTTALQVLVQLTVLSLGYWILDRIIRQEALFGWLERLRQRRPGLDLALGMSLFLLLVLAFRWESVSQPAVTRGIVLSLSALMTWKVVTQDIDLVTGETRSKSRLILLASWLGTWWNPAFALITLILLTLPYRQWRHHAILLMRDLLAAVGFCCVRQLSPILPDSMQLYLPNISTLLFFLFTIHSSHYLSAGLEKLKIGSRWYSWIVENRLHYMPANAYAWGWARFIPWNRWKHVVRLTRRVERPLQVGSVLLELLAPLALLSPEVALGACLIWSTFHVMVLALGGIFFWDWIGANMVLGLAMLQLTPELRGAWFGWEFAMLSVGFIVLFPLRNRLWGPIPLAWWETPVTQRMHWVVQGISGSRYEVFNNFMCPHERLYGIVNALFLAPSPLISYDLGTVWEADHRDAVIAAATGKPTLDEVRTRFGVQPRSHELATNHLHALHRFFYALNRGARKHVLPPGLRWLKAPGGHLYLWGDLPAYRGQEPVVRVEIHFKEHCFDGETLQQVSDHLVVELQIDSSSGQLPCAGEPASRDVERFISSAFWNRPRTPQ